MNGTPLCGEVCQVKFWNAVYEVRGDDMIDQIRWIIDGLIELQRDGRVELFESFKVAHGIRHTAVGLVAGNIRQVLEVDDSEVLGAREESRWQAKSKAFYDHLSVWQRGLLDYYATQETGRTKTIIPILIGVTDRNTFLYDPIDSTANTWRDVNFEGLARPGGVDGDKTASLSYYTKKIAIFIAMAWRFKIPFGDVRIMRSAREFQFEGDQTTTLFGFPLPDTKFMVTQYQWLIKSLGNSFLLYPWFDVDEIYPSGRDMVAQGIWNVLAKLALGVNNLSEYGPLPHPRTEYNFLSSYVGGFRNDAVWSRNNLGELPGEFSPPDIISQQDRFLILRNLLERIHPSIPNIFREVLGALPNLCRVKPGDERPLGPTPAASAIMDDWSDAVIRENMGLQAYEDLETRSAQDVLGLFGVELDQEPDEDEEEEDTTGEDEVVADAEEVDEPEVMDA